MDAHTRKPAGVTLIEALIALVLLTILAAVAVPAYADLSAALRMRSARGALFTAFHQARIAAVQRGGAVVACPSGDQVQCSGSPHWHDGWLVFADDDGDRERGPGEHAYLVAGALPPGLTAAGSAGRPRITYRPDGSAHGSNLTVTFCDRRGAGAATALIVNVYGRVRSGPPSPAAIERCVAMPR
ncbi:MAG TPA: GspH/FimT family pseudopilin [Dokdonella sp.]|uniref:GspH/FimT family pseudopilin n=1 Tax=Dokdonella sp. TaxID=2291710 RepID=UPI002CDCD226|nr:GspH/FimT family pseudopilin [Dokdonella sp.]HUD41980.1 GspH/FimT family pseudopilin [Dokdonella sp.]